MIQRELVLNALEDLAATQSNIYVAKAHQISVSLILDLIRKPSETKQGSYKNTFETVQSNIETKDFTPKCIHFQDEYGNNRENSSIKLRIDAVEAAFLGDRVLFDRFMTQYNGSITAMIQNLEKKEVKCLQRISELIANKKP